MTEEVAKKKRVNGKAKGNGYELKISKMMTTALAPLQFRRSQGSRKCAGWC